MKYIMNILRYKTTSIFLLLSLVFVTLSFAQIDELQKARMKAVAEAWNNEKELVEVTGKGTREWTEDELAELKKTGKVKGYEGHHINDVKNNPEQAGDPDNIKFVKGRKEHLLEHGGNFKNPTKGPLLKRKKLVEAFKKQNRIALKTKPIFKNPRSLNHNEAIKTFEDFKKLKLQYQIQKSTVRPGVLLSSGRLAVSFGKGVMIFAIESGIATYKYYQGDIFRPEFEREVQDAAVKGLSVGGGVAVAVILGSNPAGIIVAGVAAGTYLITDTVTTIWHEYHDSKYLNREDLSLYGIELDSVLNISDPDVPLNSYNWR